jgi:hypothetical protein
MRFEMLCFLGILYVSAVFLSDTVDCRTENYAGRLAAGDWDYADLLDVPRNIPQTSYKADPSSDIKAYGASPPTYSSNIKD